MSTNITNQLAFALQRLCSDQTAYEEGLCPELALAVHKLVSTAQLKVCTRTWIEEGDKRTNKLSHAVIETEGETFDFEGKSAEERWEARWENYPTEGESDVEFSWNYVTPEILRSLKISQTNKPVDEKLVNELISSLKFFLKITHPDPTRRIFFHGTSTENFSPKFKNVKDGIGIHIGTLACACEQIYDKVDETETETAILHPFRLTAKKILTLPDLNHWGVDCFNAVLKTDLKTHSEIHQHLLNQGYDAIAYDNEREGGNERYWPFDRTSYIILTKTAFKPVNTPTLNLITSKLLTELVDDIVVFNKTFMTQRTNKIPQFQIAPPKTREREELEMA